MQLLKRFKFSLQLLDIRRSLRLPFFLRLDTLIQLLPERRDFLDELGLFLRTLAQFSLVRLQRSLRLRRSKFRSGKLFRKCWNASFACGATELREPCTPLGNAQL